MTPDTPKPPAPSPVSAETLEQQNVFADIGVCCADDHLAWSNKLIAMTQERDDALRRLQSTEQERFNGDHWFAEATKQAQRAEAAEQERDSYKAAWGNLATLRDTFVEDAREDERRKWQPRAEAAEQKLREQEKGTR